MFAIVFEELFQRAAGLNIEDANDNADLWTYEVDDEFNNIPIDHSNAPPVSGPAECQKDPIRTIYVGHIHFNATYAEVEKFFSRFGKVVNVFIKKRQYPKKVTYGFVTYADPENAQKCLQNKYYLTLRGHRLFVNAADSWHQPTLNPDGSLRFTHKFNPSQPTVQTNQEESDDEELEPGSSIIDDSLINQLNDDCLLKIFDYIPLQSKHILNSVCSRWYALMTTYWHRIRTLNFQSGPFSKVACTATNLKMYFELCPNVKTVTIGSPCMSVPTDCITAIAENCPQAEDVSIVNMFLSDRQLAALAHYCRGLKAFSMTNCVCQRDGGIGSILKKCHQLETLKVNSSSKSTGHWLQYVSSNLKKLMLNVDCVDFKYLNMALIKVSHCLEELSLDFLYGKHNGASFTLVKCPPLIKLKKLALFGSFCYTPHLMKNLTHLELESNECVDDAYMNLVIEGSPDLEKLSLAGSGDQCLTANGLCEITRLTNLKVLHISKIGVVNDVVVKRIAQYLKELTELSLYGCDEVTDASCKRIVTDLPQLRVLDITYCLNITVDTMLAATAAADANPRKPHLTIFPLGTKMDLCFLEPSPKVKLCPDRKLNGGNDFLLDDFTLYDSDFDSEFDISYESGEIFSDSDEWGMGMQIFDDAYLMLR